MKQKKSWISGSITVEAALVVPVFILAVYAFLYFFCILQVQEDLHYAASRSCELISSYGGMLKDILTEDEDIKEAGVDKTLLNEAKKQLMDSVTLKLLVSAKMEHLYLADACIEKGLSGVSFFGSSLSDSEGCVTVVMSYYIRIPLAGFGQLRYPVIQRVSIRNFSGHYVASRLTKQEGQGGEENAGDPIVYITKNGTVYHMTSACTYIRRSVSSVLYSRIEEKRNE
ncbi:MAG: pilus assembly protein, partial [Lachnospiraceae bacterium]|nr:pilus assembly protein [Lachnospiraceae bacterium]